MTIESFKYTMDTIVLKFLPNAVQFHHGLTLLHYSISNFTLVNCSTNYTTGAYPCLEIGIIFERNFGFYLKAVFIPSAIITMLSFLAFWIAPDFIMARIATGFFCVLAMTFPTYQAYSGLPRIAYMTSMEVWLAGCMLFIFCSLLESVAIHFRNQGINSGYNPGYPATNDGKAELSYTHNSTRKGRNSAQCVDIISRIAFPLGFAMFNVAYWVLYTT